MSVTELPAVVSSHAVAAQTRAIEAIKTRIDNALVRNDAWFLVFTAVILGLGATLLAGMAVWCVVYKGKRFTGEWSFRNFGLKVRFECV
jgi:hypothetical protein